MDIHFNPPPTLHKEIKLHVTKSTTKNGINIYCHHAFVTIYNIFHVFKLKCTQKAPESRIHNNNNTYHSIFISICMKLS